AVLKIRCDIVKRALNEERELLVQRIVMRFKVFENFRAVVKSALPIALPCINGIATSLQFQLFDSLTECAVGDAAERAEFNEQAWPQRVHQKHCERNVCSPCALNKSLWIRKADWMI